MYKGRFINKILVAILIFSFALFLINCGGGGGSEGGLVYILVQPNYVTSITVGNTQQYRAIGVYPISSTSDWFDANYIDITGQVTWTSSNTAVATIDSSGLATGVAEGSTTIIARLEGIDGSLTITVTAPSSATVGWY